MIKKQKMIKRGMNINPDKIFRRIEAWINKHLPSSDIPVGFEVIFRIHKNTLTFDLIDENDVINMINIIHELFDRLKHDAEVQSKEEFKETIYFPFEAGSNKENILVTVIVYYRYKAKWMQHISVQKEF
ncbi:MAG: hypothetical protein JSV49_08935 [Thermoplasmata archaeon]|nr:MAG: hypothetical protein JSV49_08935 [Thermoplasmata archaeon]